MAASTTPRRATRKTAAIVEIEPSDAMSQVLEEDDAHLADGVSDVLAHIRAIANDDSKINIYKVNTKGGSWEYIKTLTPPFDMDTLLDDLRDEWGGGNYTLRVLAKGKIVTTKQISIAGPPKVPTVGQVKSEGSEMIPLLLQQINSSKSDNMAMMTMMMQSQQQAAAQQSQMMMGLMTALIPVMAGNKQDPVALIQAFAAMQPQKDNAPMSEMIQNMIAMKELMGDGGGGGSEDSFMGSAAKALLPMLAKGAESMVNTNPQSPLNTDPRNHPPPMSAMRPAPMLAMRPNPTAFAPPPMPPLNPSPIATAPVTPGPASGLMALIGEDVLYFAKRGHDPAMSAGAILDVIENAGISEDEILAMVIQFQSSPDWIADLAGQGIDLTGRREWATQLLSELVKQYADVEDEDDHPVRGGGGATDAGTDEENFAGGI